MVAFPEMVYFGYVIPFVITAVTIFILQGFGLYSIAKRRNVGIPWLGFVPIASFWLVGVIADDYRQRAEGVYKNYAKTMLILFGSALGVALVSVAMLAFGAFIGVAIMSLVSVVSLVGMIYYYISLYYLYNSCRGVSSGGYIALSVIFPVTIPIFLFNMRHRDDGFLATAFGKPLY